MQENDPYCIAVVRLLKDRSKRIAELVDNSVCFFKDPEGYEEKAAKKHFVPQAAAALLALADKLKEDNSFSKTTLDALFHAFAVASNTPIGELVHPTRLAISGVSFGPGLFEMMELLGRETVLRRIIKAVEKIKAGFSAT